MDSMISDINASDFVVDVGFSSLSVSPPTVMLIYGCNLVRVMSFEHRTVGDDGVVNLRNEENYYHPYELAGYDDTSLADICAPFIRNVGDSTNLKFELVPNGRFVQLNARDPVADLRMKTWSEMMASSLECHQKSGFPKKCRGKKFVAVVEATRPQYQYLMVSSIFSIILKKKNHKDHPLDPEHCRGESGANEEQAVGRKRKGIPSLEEPLAKRARLEIDREPRTHVSTGEFNATNVEIGPDNNFIRATVYARIAFQLDDEGNVVNDVSDVAIPAPPMFITRTAPKCYRAAPDPKWTSWTVVNPPTGLTFTRTDSNMGHPLVVTINDDRPIDYEIRVAAAFAALQMQTEYYFIVSLFLAKAAAEPLEPSGDESDESLDLDDEEDYELEVVVCDSSTNKWRPRCFPHVQQRREPHFRTPDDEKERLPLTRSLPIPARYGRVAGGVKAGPLVPPGANPVGPLVRCGGEPYREHPTYGPGAGARRRGPGGGAGRGRVPEPEAAPEPAPRAMGGTYTLVDTGEAPAPHVPPRGRFGAPASAAFADDVMEVDDGKEEPYDDEPEDEPYDEGAHHDDHDNSDGEEEPPEEDEEDGEEMAMPRRRGRMDRSGGDPMGELMRMMQGGRTGRRVDAAAASRPPTASVRAPTVTIEADDKDEYIQYDYSKNENKETTAAQWVFLDQYDEEQGPFTSAEMAEWEQEGQFDEYPDLPLRKITGREMTDFLPLSEWYENDVSPFDRELERNMPPELAAQFGQMEYRERVDRLKALCNGAPAATLSKDVPTLKTLALNFVCNNYKLFQNVRVLPPDLLQTLLTTLMKQKKLDQSTIKGFDGSSLTEYVLDGYENTTNEVLRGILRNLHLAKLSCKGCVHITDAVFKDMQYLEQLRYLDFAQCRVTDAGLRTITEVPHLRVLRLDHCPVTAVGLTSLAGMSELVELSVRGTPLDSASVAHLTALTALATLDISNTKVGDPGLQSLTQLPSLTALSMRVCPVTNAGMGALAGLRGLVALDLGGTNVTDTGMALLSGLTALTSLGLPTPRGITDATLATLAPHLGRLTTLDLTDAVGVRDKGARALSVLTNLTNLSLANTRITDIGMAHLTALKRLVVLDLERMKGITHLGLQNLAALDQLATLSLALTPVNDGALEVLCGLAGLTSLNLARTRITDEGAEILGRCVHLRQLNLVGTQVTAEAFACLSPLQHLEILAGVPLV